MTRENVFQKSLIADFGSGYSYSSLRDLISFVILYLLPITSL